MILLFLGRPMIEGIVADGASKPAIPAFIIPDPLSRITIEFSTASTMSSSCLNLVILIKIDEILKL